MVLDLERGLVVRQAVERLRNIQHGMGLFVRTIGIARARIKLGMANLRLQSYPLLAPGANCARMTAKAAQTSVAMPRSANPINLNNQTEAIAVTSPRRTSARPYRSARRGSSK
ncbi:MAG: hypothetical protein EOS10_33465 [Mesorhizobium sp.]|nr:MAG: hypothetical protein EOS10_33465 [Mesorhizobium sp.]